MTIRPASHAGSWYTDHGPTLKKQLQGWLDQVDNNVNGVGNLPVPGARVIIAPYVSSLILCLSADDRTDSHAGYAYSGPAAAWAYRSLDISQAYCRPIIPVRARR